MSDLNLTRAAAPVSFGVSLPIGQMIRTARSRRTLRALTDAQLSDIGIDRETALSEANRPFWDLAHRCD